MESEEGYQLESEENKMESEEEHQIDVKNEIKRNENITPFKDLKITIMTLIVTLTNGVNTDIAFQFLPIKRINIVQTRESSKCKLPHCPIPGSIISMRCRTSVRGIIRNKSKPFKNAVTIDISTIKKNISLKLSTFTMQMCGASSVEDGVEAANHLLNHLRKIQGILNIVQSDLVKAKNTIEWFKNQIKGESVFKTKVEVKNFKNISLKIIRKEEAFNIIPPKEDLPEEFNEELVAFLTYLCEDFIYHGDLCPKLDFILKIPQIIADPLEIERVDKAMVNYNYSLGFEVDRTLLNKMIDGKYGLISRYNNALATSVTIELPYIPSKETSIKRRKNKIPHHTFLVYRSGSVTQSGPGGDIMEEAYYLFMNTILELKPYIKYVDDEKTNKKQKDLNKKLKLIHYK